MERASRSGEGRVEFSCDSYWASISGFYWHWAIHLSVIWSWRMKNPIRSRRILHATHRDSCEFHPSRILVKSCRLLRAPMRPPLPARPLAFPTIDSLAAFLRPRLPASALASWGSTPGTKTLLNLFLELSHGDCELLLATDPPRAQHPAVVRAVHVATVRIHNRRGARLVETRQLLSDGTLRRRGPRPLSEKMRPGESPEAAAARAVREELGERVRVRILGGCGAGGAEAEPRVEERDSTSYSGLPARYVLHAVDAEVVQGVPEDGEFETEETGEDEGEGGGEAITVKRHYWKWIDDDEEDHKDAAEGARARSRMLALSTKY